MGTMRKYGYGQGTNNSESAGVPRSSEESIVCPAGTLISHVERTRSVQRAA